MYSVIYTGYRRSIYRVLRVGRGNAVVDALQLIYVGHIAARVADRVFDHQRVSACAAVFQTAVDVGQSQRS